MASNDDPLVPGRLSAAMRDLDPAFAPAAWLERLIAAGLDQLPLPARGSTLVRWQSLAAVAAHDLSLAKLYEGHTDALAILDELGHAALPAPDASWGVWAAEAPQGRMRIVGGVSGSGGRVTLSGDKCWCSGAASATHALLTAWRDDDPTHPQLVAVDLRQPGIRVSASAWHALGMAGSASLDVNFSRVEGRCVGRAGAYLARPGFWQGGAGIAACWYGGALALAGALHRQAQRDAAGATHPSTGFRYAALGRVDLAMSSTAALLRECAGWIDAHPHADAAGVAGRARLAAEACATSVLDTVGRALGAAPFCRDARFARAATDLPVFIRQSHAERDLAALGERVAQQESNAWPL
jgi:alkylation response protein AidB-like acyl-CoA dehydrogenase